MDLALFLALNEFAGQEASWDSIVIFSASYLQYILGALLILIALFPRRRMQMLGAAILSSATVYVIVRPIILHFVHRARPFAALDDVRSLIDVRVAENFQSFPSCHALVFFAIAMAVYRYDTRWGTAFFIGALGMGIARIISGVHWPSDILGGAVIGMIFGWLLVEHIPWFRRAAL